MSQTARNPKVVVLAVFVVALLAPLRLQWSRGRVPGGWTRPRVPGVSYPSRPRPRTGSAGTPVEAGIGWDSVSLDASAEVKADAMVPRT